MNVVRRLSLIVVLALCADVAFAESNAERIRRARFSNVINHPAPERLPVSLGEGSSLTLISPSQWRPVARRLSRYLTDVHGQFRALFGEIPRLQASVKLMEESQFYESTGAPSWTNAMYYRGEILIPLAADEAIDEENLMRSVKHEYTHAVVSALSAGRCPGWLDEGLAQWIEGPANPLLDPALRNWLRSHQPVSLSLLQGGFTRLDSKMVPAAYGQSLFAAKRIIKDYGVSTLSRYFERLRNGDSRDQAFDAAFRVDEDRFENILGVRLRRWAESSEHLHRHGPDEDVADFK